MKKQIGALWRDTIDLNIKIENKNQSFMIVTEKSKALETLHD